MLTGRIYSDAPPTDPPSLPLPLCNVTVALFCSSSGEPRWERVLSLFTISVLFLGVVAVPWLKWKRKWVLRFLFFFQLVHDWEKVFIFLFSIFFCYELIINCIRMIEIILRKFKHESNVILFFDCLIRILPVNIYIIIKYVQVFVQYFVYFVCNRL